MLIKIPLTIHEIIQINECLVRQYFNQTVYSARARHIAGQRRVYLKVEGRESRV